MGRLVPEPPRNPTLLEMAIQDANAIRETARINAKLLTKDMFTFYECEYCRSILLDGQFQCKNCGAPRRVRHSKKSPEQWSSLYGGTTSTGPR